MKKIAWLAVLFCGLVVGYIVYSSFSPKAFRCHACISFNGGRDCRTASADTRQEALRAAVTNACAQLASGVSESMRCEHTAPDSVEWQ